MLLLLQTYIAPIRQDNEATLRGKPVLAATTGHIRHAMSRSMKSGLQNEVSYGIESRERAKDA